MKTGDYCNRKPISDRWIPFRETVFMVILGRITCAPSVIEIRRAVVYYVRTLKCRRLYNRVLIIGRSDLLR
jgi:hypothetical protein